MNAKHLINKKESESDVDLALILIEKSARLKIWGRLKKIFSSSEMTLTDWERLEMKRTRSAFDSNNWRNF